MQFDVSSNGRDPSSPVDRRTPQDDKLACIFTILPESTGRIFRRPRGAGVLSLTPIFCVCYKGLLNEDACGGV